MVTALAASSSEKSTATRVSGNGCANGISSAVRLAAWIAAMRATPNTSPFLGDPSQALLSGAQERKLGESVMREIRSSGGYLNDPEVNGYLNELGNRLVTAIPGAPFDFEFFAMADPGINAFALPGGFVGVNM